MNTSVLSALKERFNGRVAVVDLTEYVSRDGTQALHKINEYLIMHRDRAVIIFSTQQTEQLILQFQMNAPWVLLHADNLCAVRP